jgi:acetylornithine deacetylase/succinyl-diaminopimelate desuccinylase-like protein
MLEIVHPDKTSEILDLAQGLIRIPSVTACPQERLDEVRRAAAFIEDYLRIQGIGVRNYDGHQYPALLAGFPGQMQAPAMLSGHFDVVAPEPDDSQFSPRVEGEYLWGRGSADMKTVVATYLVCMSCAYWLRRMDMRRNSSSPVSAPANEATSCGEKYASKTGASCASN